MGSTVTTTRTTTLAFILFLVCFVYSLAFIFVGTKFRYFTLVLFNLIYQCSKFNLKIIVQNFMIIKWDVFCFVFIGKRGLVKGPKPLQRLKFYLDIKNHAVTSKLEEKIKELGGVCTQKCHIYIRTHANVLCLQIILV